MELKRYPTYDAPLSAYLPLCITPGSLRPGHTTDYLFYGIQLVEGRGFVFKQKLTIKPETVNRLIRHITCENGTFGITPETIAINAATFVGRRMAGIPDAVVSSVVVILPPLSIVGFLASYLPVWLESSAMQSAFLAMRYVVAALLYKSLIG